MLTENQLRRGVRQSSGELEAVIYRYLEITNEDPKPFVRTKTGDQILANVARFCQRALNTQHRVNTRFCDFAGRTTPYKAVLPATDALYIGIRTQRASSCPRFSSTGYRAWHAVVAAVFAAVRAPAIADLWDAA